jgi:hypothetical protein
VVLANASNPVDRRPAVRHRENRREEKQYARSSSGYNTN